MAPQLAKDVLVPSLLIIPAARPNQFGEPIPSCSELLAPEARGAVMVMQV